MAALNQDQRGLSSLKATAQSRHTWLTTFKRRSSTIQNHLAKYEEP